MRPARFFASIALAAFVIALNAAAQADPPVAISGAVAAPVFPYGEPQTFQVLGDTKGKKCAFSFSISLNGAPVSGQGGGMPATVNVDVALPWTSPDLRLPSSNGNNYSVLVKAVSSAVYCKGQFTLSFGVVPQIGKLSGISVSRKVVAVNQQVHLKVSGQTFGYCSYAGKLTRGNVDVAHATLTTLPYEYDSSFPDPGDYVSSADEIDVNGQPQGCTGHVKTTFTVIPRPVCPSANQYYQTSDDFEFGCLYPGTYLQPAAYQCPTGYSPFNQFVGSNTQWGCKEPSKPFSSLSAVNSLLGNAAAVGPGPSLGGTPKPTAPPKTATPTIVSIQSIVGKGTAWRPNNGILYAGEHYWVSVAGNVQNSGGYDPSNCQYAVRLEDIKTHKVVLSQSFVAFKDWDLGPAPAGDYRVVAVPDPGPAGNWAPACLGSAEIKHVSFRPIAAWVTGFQLVGFGHHFYGGTSNSAWSGQWCQNCDSIFSPPHDSAFMEFNPTIKGVTSGGQCAYNVTFNGHSFGGNNSMNLGTAQEVVYKNGQPGLPADQPNMYSGYNPFWSQWTDNSNTGQVIVTPGNDLIIPSCYVLGGKISKTITFTNNESAKAVVGNAP